MSDNKVIRITQVSDYTGFTVHASYRSCLFFFFKNIVLWRINAVIVIIQVLDKNGYKLKLLLGLESLYMYDAKAPQSI